MAVSKLLLRCPHCDCPFEVNPPVSLHSAYSFKKPLRGSFYGEVIQQNLVCRNLKCKKPIAIYWYAPMNYFDRI
jgi:hypothetical protein